jgi:hypothetical protein
MALTLGSGGKWEGKLGGGGMGRGMELPVLDLGEMSAAFPLADIEKILEATERQSKRKRKLPAYMMMYLSIALGLMTSVGARQVLRVLLDEYRERHRWIGPLASEAAITKARKRLGVEPLRALFQQYVRPIATGMIKSAWYRSWRVVSMDGSTLAMLDTAENERHFGRPPSSRGTAASPRLRFVGLLENGSRILFAVAHGAYRTAEATLARKVLSRLDTSMLCLADRGFYSFDLWADAACRAQLLWRVQSKLKLTIVQRLADGSFLSELRDPRGRKGKKSILVRVISFNVTVGKHSEPYRLLTTILDPKAAPAMELARLYHARWTIETMFAELKVRNQSRHVVLRSGLPDLVEQDLYGLLLAHFGIRSIMCKSARLENVEPSELSFSHALYVILRRLPEMVAFSPSGEAILYGTPPS